MAGGCPSSLLKPSCVCWPSCCRKWPLQNALCLARPSARQRLPPEKKSVTDNSVTFIKEGVGMTTGSRSMKKHRVFLFFGVDCAKNVENCSFLYCWSAYGSPLGSVAASTIWEVNKKKVKKSMCFATFFSPAELGLCSGWVGYFKSRGFV